MRGFLSVFLMFCAADVVVHCNDEDKRSGSSGVKIKPLDIYRKLLRTKRKAHREAVATMLKMDDKFDQQHKMVAMMLQQIFKMSEEKKQLMEKLNVKPQDPYPEDEEKREAVSMVIENTAFLGEIVLHLPDLTHDILRKHNEWDDLIRWCVNFTNDTRILQTNDQKMLNLMAQELNIIEKEADFNNPYKEEAIMEQAVEEEMERILKEQKKKEERQKKRKKNRGPSLGGSHTEL